MAGDTEQLNGNNPFLPFGPQDMQPEIDYDGGEDPVYVGIAVPGTLTSEKKWQISKLTFTNGVFVRRVFAGAAGGGKDTQTNQFVWEWDERANYNYTA